MSFGVVPLETNAWKPDTAPQAMVMNTNGKTLPEKMGPVPSTNFVIAGIFSSGYHCNQAKLAPNGYLTGAEWAWEKVYTDMVNDMKAGKAPGNFVRGGLKEGFVRTSAYGPAAKGTDKDDAAKAALLAGTFAIYKGGLKDNKGNVVIPAGTNFAITEPKLESMNYLVEGVIGSTS